MLVTAKEILKDAREKRYAVPGFNFVGDMMLRGILDRCQTLRAPVFAMVFWGDMDDLEWQFTPGAVTRIAPQYDIPLVLHLDHATDFDVIRRALDCGFTSVMYDGSHHPFDVNVENTAKVVEMAKPYGASVEAELGLVGGFGLRGSDSTANILTQPEEVVAFVEQTGVDLLAVSIGTAHGMYTQQPVLDIPLLQKLDAVSTVPLVLHGGSGTPDDQMQAAFKNGICKFNVYTDLRVGMWKRFQELAADCSRPDPLPIDIFAALRDAVGDVVEEKTRIADACGRV